MFSHCSSLMQPRNGCSNVTEMSPVAGQFNVSRECGEMQNSDKFLCCGDWSGEVLRTQHKSTRAVYGRSAPWSIRPGSIGPFTGRSAPPSWSIRPVEFEGRKGRGNGADRPRRCTRLFRSTHMSRLNESTCERSRGCRRHYSFTQAMPTVAPRPSTIPRRIFELGLTHSHTVATWH